MPTYKYECTDCSHAWEDVRRIDDRDTPLSEPCPECKKENFIIKVMGAPMIGDPMRLDATRKQPSPEFQEKMKRIKTTYPTLRPESSSIWEDKQEKIAK